MRNFGKSETISTKEKLGDFFIDIAKLVFTQSGIKYLIGFNGRYDIDTDIRIISTVMLIMGFELYKRTRRYYMEPAIILFSFNCSRIVGIAILRYQDWKIQETTSEEQE